MLLKIISLIFLILLYPLYPSFVFSEEPKNNVLVITINGVINPVATEYIGKSIKMANEKKVEALVIELDTPGGLDTSMRRIVKDIIGSEVPVVVFVSPSGSRAASAGVFITLAAHVAAMAPGTNIGAAHPVGIGEKMDKVMAEKAVNDAAAYIKSLAERSGRNARWAEDAVRKSISATEEDALKQNVIDIVSKDLNSLLSDIDGRKVRTVIGERVLSTAKANVIKEEMGLRHRILNLISDPNIAYILMLLGFYGLFFELTNPGSIFPGATGALCLILAFYSLHMLPVNYAGLLLILLAIILFILEVKVTSYGLLSVGGIISMILGSLMLFREAPDFLRLSLSVVIPATIFTALFFILTLSLAYKAYRRKPVTGVEELIASEGSARTDIHKKGSVFVHGEIWSAWSDEPIQAGEEIVVERVNGLKLKVKRKEVDK